LTIINEITALKFLTSRTLRSISRINSKNWLWTCCWKPEKKSQL